MALDIDRAKREKQLKKEQERRAKEDAKQRSREARSASRVEATDAKFRNRRSSAGRENVLSMRTMLLSSAFLLIIFIVFEVALFAYSGNFGDMSTHLLNMADNTLAFVIGLGAMDVVTYINLRGRTKRNEYRAIIRYNRLLEPSIDAFIARKNAVITPDKVPLDQYRVKTAFTADDMVDMFSVSPIASDAGKTKLASYSFQQKKLYKAFQNLVMEVDFSYEPDICEAAMMFLNACDNGISSLQALLILDEGTKVQKNAIIRALKADASADSPDTVHTETMAVRTLMQSIREQEEAIKLYNDSVAHIVDPDRS